MSSNRDEIGLVLSQASTSEAAFQLYEEAEKGDVHEGMLVVIECEGGKRRILARISEIVPFHAFYAEGAPWSESIRKKLKLPEGIARQYRVCKADLLIEFPRSLEVNVPPSPGDRVFRIDPEKQVEEIFDVKRGKEGKIWFGTLSGYENVDAPVPLDVEAIPMHIAVFGVTGSGKSFDVGAFIEKLYEIPTNEEMRKISIPMVIIDAHGDYTNYAEERLKRELGVVENITRYIFPNVYNKIPSSDPSLKYTKCIGINLNRPVLTPREVAELIIQYYRGEIGPEQELQVTGLTDALTDQEEAFGTRPQEIFTSKGKYQDFYNDIQQVQAVSGQTKAAIQRALDKFRSIETNLGLLSADSPLKSESFIDDLTSRGNTAIIDFSSEGATGVELAEKQIVMSYLAAVLFKRFTDYKIKEKTARCLLFVIEESQNFCPSPSYPVGVSLAKAKLSAIATQGRKFGLSLCLISQRPSFVDPVILSMCNTFFIHRISPDDVHFVRTVTGGLSAGLSARLTKLGKGEMIITGQMCTVPFPLIVKVRKKDRTVDHPRGTIDVVRNLLELRKG